MSILEWLVKNNVYTAKYRCPLTISSVHDLETKGGGATGRAVAYRRWNTIDCAACGCREGYVPVNKQRASSCP